jgi:hypothetical protein
MSHKWNRKLRWKIKIQRLPEKCTKLQAVITDKTVIFVGTTLRISDRHQKCSFWMFMYLTSLLSRPHAIKHTYTHTHSVRFVRTSDQPDAETSTWQHTTLTTDRHPCPWRDSTPQSQQASGRRPRLRPPGHWDRLNLSHQQTADRDPQTACLTQAGLTASLRELTSSIGLACEARDESRRGKKKRSKLINSSANLCLVIASVFTGAWEEVFIDHALKKVRVWFVTRTLIFEITNYKLRPVVSHSRIWRSPAVELPCVHWIIIR